MTSLIGKENPNKLHLINISIIFFVALIISKCQANKFDDDIYDTKGKCFFIISLFI